MKKDTERVSSDPWKHSCRYGMSRAVCTKLWFSVITGAMTSVPLISSCGEWILNTANVSCHFRIMLSNVISLRGIEFYLTIFTWIS